MEADRMGRHPHPVRRQLGMTLSSRGLGFGTVRGHHCERHGRRHLQHDNRRVGSSVQDVPSTRILSKALLCWPADRVDA